MRRLELMQWFGLLAAPLAWTVQLVAGFWVANANCARAGLRWDVPAGGWQVALTAAAATVAVSAEVTAVSLYRELRDVHDDAPGPRGRLHFFAIAGVVGNVLFLGLIALTGFGAIWHSEWGCRPA